MKTLETVALVKGEERIVVNKRDEAIFTADGWIQEGQDSDPAKGAEIKHVGGGIYELPNGDRVKGKEEAAAAWAAIQAAAGGDK